MTAPAEAARVTLDLIVRSADAQEQAVERGDIELAETLADLSSYVIDHELFDARWWSDAHGAMSDYLDRETRLYEAVARAMQS